MRKGARVPRPLSLCLAHLALCPYGVSGVQPFARPRPLHSGSGIGITLATLPPVGGCFGMSAIRLNRRASIQRVPCSQSRDRKSVVVGKECRAGGGGGLDKKNG